MERPGSRGWRIGPLAGLHGSPITIQCHDAKPEWLLQSCRIIFHPDLLPDPTSKQCSPKGAEDP